MSSSLSLYRSAVPADKQELLLAGLNLLRLLVQNRIAEFHTELELLPQEVSLVLPLPLLPWPLMYIAADMIHVSTCCLHIIEAWKRNPTLIPGDQ